MRKAGSVLVVLLGLTAHSNAYGQDPCNAMTSVVGLNSYNFFQITGDYHPAVGNAADQWNSACDSMVPYFNPFSSQPGSSVEIEMHLSESSVTNPCGPDVCGCTALNVTSGGTVLGGDVWAFETNNGNTCGTYSQVIAHEFGHVLGFTGGSAICLGRIMYETSPAPPASPGFSECSSANMTWYTEWESPDPCDWPDTNDPTCGTQGGGSPILLDLDGNGIHLCGQNDAVIFDLDADGYRESITWTRQDSGDSFLWKDRNGNGLVDDGRELFGTSTPLSSGVLALNGYVALAEFDTQDLGGNSDGYIDTADAVFSQLLLWVDTNHDGLSDADEISTLVEMGVLRLQLSYRRSIRKDQHGNLFRYISRAWIVSPGQGASRPIQSIDVFFVLAE